MMPPKPPRKSRMTKSVISGSCEIPQPAYEDLDASTPDVPNESQSEVRVKPVPRPRSKIQPKAQRNIYNTNNTNNTCHNVVDVPNESNNTTSAALDEEAANKPHPVRPPPLPPVTKCLTSSTPMAAVDGWNQHMGSNTEPTVEPPAASTERKQKPPPPERPPLPSIYYDRPSVKVIQFESNTGESEPPTQQTPDFSEEEGNLFGTYGQMAPNRPAVPPRQSSHPQTRPPPPKFNPPPPPSAQTISESVYSQLEHCPYVDILPEDGDTMHHQSPRRSMQRSGPRNQNISSRRQTVGEADEITVMLRWLTRVSKSDYMTPSLYGLTIEEEIRSFDQRATNVCKAMRLYNLLLMKRNEGLRHVLAEFSSISHSLDKMKKRTKTISIAGGTTGAVGGVTAVLGLALAPVTMGASLIATAVGAGMVASAGGMGAHSANANKKTVNKIKVEKLVGDYKADIVDVEHCLDFILAAMNELRRHDVARLQRAGAQPDAMQMAHLSQSVFRSTMNNERRTSVAHPGGSPSETLLQAFSKELDYYFTEFDNQKLKKSSKSKFSGRIRLLGENLQEQLEYLNRMWEMFS